MTRITPLKSLKKTTYKNDQNDSNYNGFYLKYENILIILYYRVTVIFTYKQYQYYVKCDFN